MAWGLLLCSNLTAPHLHPSSALPSQILLHGCFRGTPAAWRSRRRPTISGRSGGFLLGRRLPFRGPAPCTVKKGNDVSPAEGWPSRRMLQAALWAAEAVYILWLFLLPYAPGDPVWAIKLDTINDIAGLSLNFFFILPLLNTVGIHVLEAPVLHPMAEGLFNFVIGWTLLFAPLLFTDCQRDRYKGSLDLLWGFQMFLTNTFLIPYMAMRLNDIDVKHSPSKQSQLGLLMTNGASFVGIAGGTVCLISTLWTIFGRSNMGFGGIADRWEFLERYVGSERLAYAFIWDICLYAIFQPWLIGDNLQNVKKNNEQIVRNLRFIPVVGLVAYLLSLDKENVL
ncbi:uncharacterized protein [Elaeis guineensis]|uniref:Uncharacterized protein LOC105035666 isoform X2 n=1 Tax=Elaeis guineensis var. tenera TaxID=51953 RepID=A0A6I9QHJ9_ELAGV|nr:uncharacterized protein LOC105035666 isoform X2 [Elaeis guineensis]